MLPTWLKDLMVILGTGTYTEYTVGEICHDHWIMTVSFMIWYGLVHYVFPEDICFGKLGYEHEEQQEAVFEDSRNNVSSMLSFW